MVEYPQYKRSGNLEVGVILFGLGVGKIHGGSGIVHGLREWLGF